MVRCSYWRLEGERKNSHGLEHDDDDEDDDGDDDDHDDDDDLHM